MTNRAATPTHGENLIGPCSQVHDNFTIGVNRKILIDLFTLLSPLVSRPVTWRDFALLHTHGPNCSIVLFNYNVFDDDLIRYL